MFKEVVPSTGKIYQKDFPKVAPLKCSGKGALSRSFEHWVGLMDFVWGIDESYQRDFPKVIALKRSTKGAMCNYFRRAPCA